MFLFRVLDLYCGAGGASFGMSKALEASCLEYEIIGIDIQVQSRYPFNRRTMNVLDMSCSDLEQFDFIWASPPCQRYSLLSYVTKKEYPDLIPFTRDLLIQAARPYVIENVEYAPLRKDLLLCGEMFGLKVFKHRIFETNFCIKQPAHNKHIGSVKHGDYFTTAGNGGCKSGYIREWQAALGIDWMYDKHLLAEAVPPAYSCYIMEEFIQSGRINHEKENAPGLLLLS